MSASLRACAYRCLIAGGIVGFASAGSAQDALTSPITPDALRDDLDKRCANASVVVLRCIAPRPVELSNGDDGLERSRQRAKAAFDRRDRRATEEARGGDAIATLIDGRAQRLAPVIVTGQAPYAPAPTVEQILEHALRPPPLPTTATVTYWNNDGGRTECIARCVGPMCCMTVSPQPNAARDAFAIGR